MIIVDTALAKRQAENNPIKVGMVGAGFMGKAIALQICGSVPGMELVAIANRTVDNARQAYDQAGVNNAEQVNSILELEINIKNRRSYRI